MIAYDADIQFPDVDWRSVYEIDNDDDEDIPTESYVLDTLGFDPDEFALNMNPNHDEDGKFASGDGSGEIVRSTGELNSYQEHSLEELEKKGISYAREIAEANPGGIKYSILNVPKDVHAQLNKKELKELGKLTTFHVEVVESTKELEAIRGLKAASEAHIATLSATQVAAIQDYTDEGYKAINNAMRQGKLKGETKKAADAIVKAIDSAPKFKTPINVSRVLDFEKPATHEKFLAAMRDAAASGKDVQFPSIVSTTLGLGFKPKTDKGIKLFIRAKSGLYVNSISAKNAEDEVMQSPKTKYKVLGVRQRADGSHAVDMEEI